MPAVIPNHGLTYFKDHLLVASFRGDIYQLTHFIRFCLHHLFKERAFQAKVESRGFGNLDDIQIELPSKVKAYQVKFFKNPIKIEDFYNHDEDTTKNVGLHIGKFFDGWLSLKGRLTREKKDNVVCPYLLTNTSLAEDFLNLLETMKEKEGIPLQLRFKEAFIEEEEKSIYKITKTHFCHLKKISKNFLQEKGVASADLSTNIWTWLKDQDLWNNQGFPTQNITQYEIQFSEETFARIKGKARGTLSHRRVIEKLKSIKENYTMSQREPLQTKISLFRHLFEQACLYLKKQEHHLDFLEINDQQRLEQFKEFTEALRFNINRESLDALHQKTQTLIQCKFQNEPVAPLYSHIQFGIQHWFSTERPFYPNQGEETPIIDEKSMQEMIDSANIYTKQVEKLFRYSNQQLEQVETTIQGHQISRSHLLEQIEKSDKRCVLIVGPKGVGKSALIKMYIEKNCCPWFAFNGKALGEEESLAAFGAKHALVFDDAMFTRYEKEKKKIAYIDAIEVVEKPDAFRSLFHFFDKHKWQIVVSSAISEDQSLGWLTTIIKSLSKNDIDVVKVTAIEEKDERDAISHVFEEYPILREIQFEHLFHEDYNDVFYNPLYLKLFCEEAAKLKEPEKYFYCVKTTRKFELEIWKKVVKKNEGLSENGSSALRENLVIKIAIKQALNQSISSIMRTSSPEKSRILAELKRDQILNSDGYIINARFLDFSLKLHFEGMIDQWLLGKKLDIVADDQLGSIRNFDQIFTEFLAVWAHDRRNCKVDGLANFLKRPFKSEVRQMAKK